MFAHKMKRDNETTNYERCFQFSAFYMDASESVCAASNNVRGAMLCYSAMSRKQNKRMSKYLSYNIRTYNALTYPYTFYSLNAWI